MLSPTEMPFTQDDFDPQLMQALELMPDLLGDERVGIRYAINGLISMTPDGHPVLGETPEVPGLWSVAASLDQGGPRHRPRGGRVDERHHPGDRHSRGGHRPVLRPPAHHRARGGPGPRGLQQDVRHRAPRRAVGVRPAAAAQPGLRPGARARRGVHRDRGLGAAELVRLELRAAGAVRRAADGAHRRVGVALVVADHQRRAPGHARRRRAGRPVGLRGARRHRARRAGRRAVGGGGPARRRAGPGRLHLAAERGRRLRRRPDHHAAGPAALPGRDRRRHRHVRPEVVRRPPAGRRRRSPT